MYYFVMEKGENILAEALQKALQLRRMTPAQLARASGVDPSTISLILNGARPNTAALIIAKLARGLLVSSDYLVGLSDDPDPKSVEFGELLMELARTAQLLTSRRQRDLLMAARAYLQNSDELAQDPDLLMSNLIDMIHEAGGQVSRDQLINLIEQDLDRDDDAPLLLGDDS